MILEPSNYDFSTLRATKRLAGFFSLKGSERVAVGGGRGKGGGGGGGGGEHPGRRITPHVC